MPTLQPGQDLKGYHLIEVIGTGGFGRVFRANQLSVDRTVAIKVIRPELASQPNFIRRFESEAQFVAQLEHPFITPLYDYWRDPGGAYLVMRFFPGGSLRDRLDRGGLELERAVRLLDQVAAALNAAHRRNIVHRDIKPSNILLDKDGSAFLADFGIARQIGQPERLTETGDLIGSPDYFAPEQARSQDVSPQTDIYSLGILVHEILTGAHPYPKGPPVERLQMHLNEPIPMLSGDQFSEAARLNEVIQTATAKEPQARYPDVVQFALAFREAAGMTADSTAEMQLLSTAERQVLRHLTVNRSHREIEAAMALEAGAVTQYLQQIFIKLQVRGKAQAVAKAQELELLDDLETPESVSLDVLNNPYKGLLAFQTSDAMQFFGREAMVAHLLDRLGSQQAAAFLAVVGASGSGKSSLVRAGLIPALWAGRLTGSANWYFVDLMPGTEPLAALSTALEGLATQTGLGIGEQLARDARGLIRAARLALPEPDSKLVIVIDQFEELFTLVDQEVDRKHFIDLLTTAVTDPRAAILVILTLRADFYDRPLAYRRLARLMQAHSETISPLNPAELTAAISEPVQQIGLEFEDGLVAAIVADVQSRPGGLPLMQYALSELFERREGRLLTRRAYDDMGRAGGALAAMAESIYLEGDEEDHRVTRQLFLRLVSLGQGAQFTRRRVLRGELLNLIGAGKRMQIVIEQFASHRLLALDRDASSRQQTVEVAHEALLQAWGRLSSWLADGQADLRQQRQLARLAQEWLDSKQDLGLLLQGSRLDELSAWSQSTTLALTADETAFLSESERLQIFERKEEQVRQAREAAMEQQALRQISIGLAAQALEESAGRHPERAIPLALEALDNYPYTAQAHSALSQVVIGQQVAGRIDPGGPVKSLQVSKDGSKLLISIREDRTAVWDLDLQAIKFELLEHGPGLSQWCPDESLILTESGTRERFQIWDGQRGQLRFSQPVESPLYADFKNWHPWSSDGSAFVTGHRDGIARIWQADDGSLIGQLSGHADNCTAYWSSRGTEIVTIGDDNRRVIVWDAESGAIRFQLSFELKTYFGCWSPDGSQFVLRQFGGSRLYGLASGSEIRRFATEHSSHWAAQWSPDGQWLLTSGPNNGRAWLWEAETGALKATLNGLMQAYAVSWAPSSRYVAVGILEGVRIWDIYSELPAAHITVTGDIDFLCWSPDETMLYASDDDIGEVMVLRAHTADRHISGPAGGGGGAVCWADHGTQIGRMYGDGKVKLFDSQTFEHIRSLDSGARWGSCRGQLEGRRILTTNSDGHIRIWRAKDGELLLDIAEHTWAFSCALSPDGTRLAVYAGDRHSEEHGVIVWDAQSGQELWRIFEPRSFLGSVSWSPNGTQLAISFFSAGSAYVVDGETGEILWSIVEESAEATDISGLEWSNDGRRVAYTREGVIHILDVASREVIARGQEGQVASWTFTWLDGDRYILVTSSPDGKLHLLDAETCEAVLTYDIGGWAVGDLSPDESQLLVSTNDGSTRLYPFWKTIEELIVYARENRLQRELTPEERELFGLEP
jgi:serine/threonine protein kinase/WD40 repeat protein